MRFSFLLVLSTIVLSACASHPDRAKLKSVAPDSVATVSLDGATRVELVIPIGEARITPTDSGVVRASLGVLCKPESKKCRRRAEALQLEVRRIDNAILIVPNITSRSGYGNGDVLYRAEIPPSVSLVVDMGYGDLEIEGHASDLDVKLSAGDVSIRMPVESVANVMLDAQVGDAELNLPSVHIDGPRKLLVGAEVEWSEGEGKHSINARLNAGAIDVELYELSPGSWQNY